MDTTNNAHCIACGQVFTFNPADYTFHTPEPDGTRRTFFPDKCDPCSMAEREQANRAAKQAAEAAAREKQWQNTTPPIFRNSDTSRFPDLLGKAITGHDITSPIGIGIVGSAGTCKTRAAYVLLRRYLDAGRRIYAITGPEIAKAAAEQFRAKPNREEFSLSQPKDTGAAARHTLDACRTADVLLVDDIEKASGKVEISPRTHHTAPSNITGSRSFSRWQLSSQ